MRILHLAPPTAAPSGIAAYGARVRQAVREAGAEIEVLDRSPDTVATWAAVRRHAQAAQARAPRVDVVHAELGGGTLPEFHAAVAVARRTDTPVVLTLHDPPGVVWRPYAVGSIGRRRPIAAAVGVAAAPLARRTERWLAHEAASVAALSSRGAEAATAALRLSQPATVLPWPTDATAAPTPSAAGRAPADLPLTLGFHGLWYGGKGLDALLDAVRAVGAAGGEAIELRLLGGPPSSPGSRASISAIDAVYRGISRRGLDDVVTVVGYVDETRLAAELRRCDAIVLPYEAPRGYRGLCSVSSATFDALSAGVPVVVTDVRALGALVRHGVDGLVVPAADPAALVAAIARLRDDHTLRRRLRRGAATRAERLSEASVGETTVQWYGQVGRQSGR